MPRCSDSAPEVIEVLLFPDFFARFYLANFLSFFSIAFLFSFLEVTVDMVAMVLFLISKVVVFASLPLFCALDGLALLAFLLIASFLVLSYSLLWIVSNFPVSQERFARLVLDLFQSDSLFVSSETQFLF